jgi:hypothetical protein
MESNDELQMFSTSCLMVVSAVCLKRARHADAIKSQSAETKARPREENDLTASLKRWILASVYLPN